MQTIAIDTFDMPLLARIHQITLPTPFPVGPVHTYLLEGEPLTLVDTGPATPEARAALATQLAALGYALEDLERIVITHAHSDHFGLVGELARASRAEVWSHALAQPMVEGWDDYYRQRSGFWYDLLFSAGVPAPAAEGTARLYNSFRHLQTYAPVNRLLADGDEIEMGGGVWQVLHCPGHASSLVCFYQPENRLLIGNDHILSHISSNAIVEPPPLGAAVRRKPLIDYWEALCRVFELPILLVLTGHGEAVPNHRLLISQRFEFYERRLGRLRSELQVGPRTIWQLAEALFRRLDAVDTFLATSEIIGHLDVLEEKGGVAGSVDGDGVWWYELT